MKKGWLWVVLAVVLVVAVVFVAVGAQKKPQDVAAQSSQSCTSSVDVPSQEVNLTSLELPACDEPQYIIRCEEGRYTLFYNIEHHQAAWVAYILTRAEASYKGVERQNRFIPDPVVERNGWGAVRTSYYTGTGYDRGHLCPSADRVGNQTENDATFRLSNISPQTPALNRQTWRFLEEKVRDWAVKYDSLFIVTGGVLEAGLPTIKGGVSIPKSFYKVILCRNSGRWQAIGFIIPNEKAIAGAFWDYAVTVDSVQSVTHIDFYSALPDEIEREVEANLERSLW